jgi:acetoacetyl-CoA synthetase
MARHAHLNWAENMLLSHKHARSRTQNAVVACVEPPAGSSSSPICMRQMTFDQLYIEVAQAASTLKSFGVKPGDRVAAITPNNAGTLGWPRDTQTTSA